MKVVILSTSDNQGGAARATYRLHQSLRKHKLDSRILVKEKSSSDERVFGPKTQISKGLALTKESFDAIPLKFYQNRKDLPFSPQWVPDRVIEKVHNLSPDVVNLHWVSGGYLRIETLAKLNRPIVWTLQDMWAFTGGCHYTEGCNRYMQSCGACHQLASDLDWDLSKWIWKRKATSWRNINLTVVAPTTWMAECAQSSSLFKDLRVEVIPFCLDTEIYRPIEQAVAREVLGLPQDKKLILFGALQATSNRRKGYHLLKSALHILSKSDWRNKVGVCVFGASKQDSSSDLTGLKSHYFGYIQDDMSLAMIYSAADIMVVPSIEEAFGQTASESLACGTPVVAFNATGLKDLVTHQEDGYLAKPVSKRELTTTVNYFISEEARLAISA